MKYVLLSEKKWHESLFQNLDLNQPESWTWIRNKAEFTLEELKKLNPEKIFIPHWSYIIPPEIYETYECIVFHMTDLPFGRGGSPLQNLIARGIYDTKISALRVTEGLDTGPVYLKKPLNLNGTAEEIFLRASGVIEEMILEIISENLKPAEQTGEPEIFKRRKPEESNIANLTDINKLFDHIRMLDAEGYPAAFLEIGNFRLEFSRASLKTNNSILADVRIIQK
jgi:methionyl-tRNA formyltransferase